MAEKEIVPYHLIGYIYLRKEENIPYALILYIIKCFNEGSSTLLTLCPPPKYFNYSIFEYGFFKKKKIK